MGKNVGLTYGEFKFPAEQGFTGSAGVHKVKGYMRGGHVKKMGEGGKFGKPGDKYPTLKSGPRGKQGSSLPKNVKNRGGKVSMHDKLKHEGGKMGYAYGGQVKNTSAQFKQTRGKQDTMDHGVQPAQTGRNQAEVEAGGNKRLKAGYRKGGAIKGPKTGVHRVRGVLGRQAISGLKKIKGVMSEGDRAAMRRIASGKNMPKNVKARGGPATTPGRAKAMGLHKSAARRAPGTTRSAQGGLAKYSHGGAARKPYTGYNKQAGGSGNEDARYMQAKK